MTTTALTVEDLARSAFNAVAATRSIKNSPPESWEGQHRWIKEAYVLAVCTILAEARNASSEMVQAGADEINPYASDSTSYEQTCEAVLDAWQTMIDKMTAVA